MFPNLPFLIIHHYRFSSFLNGASFIASNTFTNALLRDRSKQRQEQVAAPKIRKR
ncbi:hypothetical protein D922_02492 [Enterococcus faecalis 06-MB-DW-09]|nr:hypothetical protein D922_02492 [Enterococcus faecalis 06-MB-DW-09]